MVVITSGDIPLLDADTLAELIAAHRAEPAAVTVLTTTVPEARGYGRILRTQDGEVIAIVEEADATPQQRAIREINAGIYAFDIAALRSALSRLSSNNAQHELYLTDAIAIVRAAGQLVHAKHIDDTALVAGVNDRVQLADLGAELNRRDRAGSPAGRGHGGRPERAPGSTSRWRSGPTPSIAPGTQLHGTTRIGARCRIGPDTTLTDVDVGDDATRGPHARQPGDRRRRRRRRPVHLPAARYRSWAPTESSGAFVETKNASIGTGTKVPHLTYVGDADIGEHSNIGASSVFVNYDGESKSRTTVGSHVRTGSDTMFVAPVTVGDGAYTGAGTVLRDDVPPGALAVSAGRQRIIEDWVLRNRPDSDSARAAARAKAGAAEPAAHPEQP